MCTCDCAQCVMVVCFFLFCFCFRSIGIGCCQMLNYWHSHMHTVSVLRQWHDVLLHMVTTWKRWIFRCASLFVACENFAQRYYVEKENKQNDERTFFPHISLVWHLILQVFDSCLTFKRFYSQFSNVCVFHFMNERILC